MKEDFKIIRNALSLDTVNLLKNTILLSKVLKYYNQQKDPNDITAFPDDQCKTGFPFYGELICDSLSVSLLPLMEKATNLKLFPTYTYGRIYWKGSILKKHKDRPSCQYSATLTIDIDSKPWPIYMAGKKLLLWPGDIAVYKGCEVEHWRETYKGNQQIQLFLHYVDANGKYKDWKFDKRKSLGMSVDVSSIENTKE
jgi:hypothetical protein